MAFGGHKKTSEGYVTLLKASFGFDSLLDYEQFGLRSKARKEPEEQK